MTELLTVSGQDTNEPKFKPLYQFKNTFEEQVHCLDGLVTPMLEYLPMASAYGGYLWPEREVPRKFLEVCERLVHLGDTVERTRKLLWDKLEADEDTVPDDLALAGRAIGEAANAYLESFSKTVFSDEGLGVPYSAASEGSPKGLCAAVGGARCILDAKDGDLTEGQLYYASFFERMLAALATNAVRGLRERQRYFSPEACDLVMAFRELGTVYERGEPIQRKDWMALQARMEAALAVTLRGERGACPNRVTLKLGLIVLFAVAGTEPGEAAREVQEIVALRCGQPTAEQGARERKFLGALITLSAANKQRCMT